MDHCIKRISKASSMITENRVPVVVPVGAVLLTSSMLSCMLRPLLAWPTWPCALQLQVLPHNVLLCFVPTIDVHAAT